VFLVTYLAVSPLPAVALAAVLVVLVRVPLLRVHGTTRLRTDDDPGTVVASFAGPTPPVLALRWGIADEIDAVDGEAVYRLSWLFGLRSAAMAVGSRTETTAGGDRRIELTVTVDGEPWATYTATVRGDGDGGATVEVAYGSDRRFGLRRLPTRLVARRHDDDALAAQGYAVVGRDAGLRIGS
jgi:hypothetical protein